MTGLMAGYIFEAPNLLKQLGRILDAVYVSGAVLGRPLVFTAAIQRLMPRQPKVSRCQTMPQPCGPFPIWRSWSF